MPTFSQLDLPKILLGLARERFHGVITLRQENVEKRFQWHTGSPIQVSSNDPEDDLLTQFLRAGIIQKQDRENVRSCMKEKGWDALRALAALQKATPRELVQGLSQQIQHALSSTFAWNEGTFEMEYVSPNEQTAAFSIPFPALVYRSIAKYWSIELALQALQEKSTWRPFPNETFKQRQRELPSSKPLKQLIQGMDQKTTAFALCQAFPQAESWAALVTLDMLGALNWNEKPIDTEEKPEEQEFQIEILTSGAPQPEAAKRQRTKTQPSNDDTGDRAHALREEIETLYAKLKECTHYDLLNIARDAKDAEIKRAYLKAAKRLHPDRLANLGLDDVKDAANTVFAQITRAHATLSDAEERRRYDASLDGNNEIDADRLAQAEVFFRKGETLLRAGNFRDAAELLDAAVQVWPEEAEYQAALAWALHRKNPPENERAIQHFEKARSLGDERAQTLLRMSLTLKEMGDAIQAGQLAQKARALDPKVTA